MTEEPAPEDRKYRNYVVAGSVGGLLLPIAGMIGALVFLQRGDERAFWTVAGASLAGLIAYVVLFAIL